MRCLSCNTILSSFEATRKYIDSQEFVDLCNYCFREIGDTLVVDERFDLMEEADEISDVDDYDEDC